MNVDRLAFCTGWFVQVPKEVTQTRIAGDQPPGSSFCPPDQHQAHTLDCTATRVPHSCRAALILTRPVNTIRARGMEIAAPEAGHMSAPDDAPDPVPQITSCAGAVTHVAQGGWVSHFPLPRTDLSFDPCDGRAERGEVVQDGDANLKVGDLTVEAPGGHALPQELDAVHRGFCAASAVKAAPSSPLGPADAPRYAQDFVARDGPFGVGLSRLGVLARQDDRCGSTGRDGARGTVVPGGAEQVPATVAIGGRHHPGPSGPRRCVLSCLPVPPAPASAACSSASRPTGCPVAPNRDNLRHDRSPLCSVAAPQWHKDAIGGRSDHQSP